MIRHEEIHPIDDRNRCDFPETEKNPGFSSGNANNSDF
jgi:hypothetical protein